jgi:DNA polymerase I-like protein with 3'-5' exonuclease and polymerase domains
MKGLEDRIKQHYIWEFDRGYVREMQKDGYDPHLTLAVSAGAITKEQMEAHIKGEEDHSDIRSLYKTVNYGCQYGAGGATIARSAGISKKEGDKLVEQYWKLNWAVKSVPKTIETKRLSDGSMWLFNPVSKFWYSLRAEKDIFSTLVQGTGVYCFDTWIAYVLSRRKQLTAQFHDEIVLCIKEHGKEPCTKLLRWAIMSANNKLKLNVKLDVDTKYGKSYDLIH